MSKNVIAFAQCPEGFNLSAARGRAAFWRADSKNTQNAQMLFERMRDGTLGEVGKKLYNQLGGIIGQAHKEDRVLIWLFALCDLEDFEGMNPEQVAELFLEGRIPIAEYVPLRHALAA